MIFVVLVYNTEYMSLFTIVLHPHMKKQSLFLMFSFFKIKLEEHLSSNSKYTIPHLFCHLQYDIHILMISMPIAREKHNLSIFTLSAVGPM